MTGSSFDGIARQLGRRHALQALGLAAVTTASGVSLAGAKKGKNNGQKKRKRKQRAEKQALARCAGQVDECKTLIAETCEGDPGCIAQGQLCCEQLATCAFAEFIACLNAPSDTPV